MSDRPLDPISPPTGAETGQLIAELLSDRARRLPITSAAWPADRRAIPISLAYGFADPALFPREELVAAAAAVLADDAAAALNYGPSFPGLVELVAERLRRKGIRASEDRVLISYGSGQVLGLLPQLFVDPGDTVIIEGPTFLGAVRDFVDAGARIVSVPIDASGMDVDALEEELRALARRGVRPKFIYTIPTFQNPTGTTLPLDRRRRLLALAAAYGIVVVEDDAYGDLRFEGEPLPPLAALDEDGWVIYVGTFSKILAPGVRMGWACARPEIVQRLASLKVEGSSGPFLTRLVARYCAEGRLDAHIVELNRLYRAKRDVMLGAIAESFPASVRPLRPEGGFFVWCELPPTVSAGELLAACEERGVTFLSGDHCFADGRGDTSLRLAFSFQPAATIAEGIARIGAALRERCD